jgi:hypothetical protein
MSLHDEFEAVKHAPSQLVAFVHSLIARIERHDAATQEIAAVAEASALAEPAAPAPEGAEHP